MPFVSKTKGRIPHRRVAVKALVAAPAEGQQTQQAAASAPQSKGYKDALMVQCEFTLLKHPADIPVIDACVFV
jgi:hypothetical protein